VIGTTARLPCSEDRVEQAGHLRILANDAEEGVVVVDAVGDELPGLASIAGAVDIGGEVVHLVAIDGEVGDVGIVGRGFDHADERPVAHVRRRDLGPGDAAVGRDVDESVIGADPDQVLLPG